MKGVAIGTIINSCLWRKLSWYVRFWPKAVRLAPNGTNPWLFQRWAPKFTEIWSEKIPDLSHLGPFWTALVCVTVSENTGEMFVCLLHVHKIKLFLYTFNSECFSLCYHLNYKTRRCTRSQTDQTETPQIIICNF